MSEWKDNTAENPYWLNKKPVIVLLKGGSSKEFKCPRCAKGWSNLVTHWKEVEKANEENQKS